jgi:lantibiotic modifying enzyme
VTYLDAAGQVAEWLVATAVRGDEGWCWPVQPGLSTEVDPGLGWGTAAPSLFLVEAYRSTGEDRWLAAAQQGRRWLASHLETTIDSPQGCGLMTGVGGWVVVLDELAEAAGDDEARSLAEGVIEGIAARATPAPGGVHWHDLTEILWGTAGIGCLLLSHGNKYLGSRALELAVGAGDWLLAEAEEARPGIHWSLGRAYEADSPRPDRRFPNFAHGAAGIGFYLARLAQASGERRFLDASLSAARWIMTTVRTENDTCAAFHHEPDGTNLFTLGWCHGPPGLGWFFRQLEIAEGSPEWRSWTRAAARSDRISGIPERRNPGFWDNVARCCGSAGVAEFFLDLHRLESRPDDLDFAIELVDDLLDRSIVDGAGRRWSNYEYRNEEPHLPPETTYLQGAPGIGSTLLRLHRHLSGDYWTVDWPHAPSWAPPDAGPGGRPDDRSDRPR